jgi:hypothetical protein
VRDWLCRTFRGFGNSLAGAAGFIDCGLQLISQWRVLVWRPGDRGGSYFSQLCFTKWLFQG